MGLSKDFLKKLVRFLRTGAEGGSVQVLPEKGVEGGGWLELETAQYSIFPSAVWEQSY